MSRAAARELGAKFDGEVLSGELSVAERFVREAAGVDGSHYHEVEEYDAVLRAHCRLDDEAKSQDG
jgi:hypothetical protein